MNGKPPNPVASMANPASAVKSVTLAIGVVGAFHTALRLLRVTAVHAMAARRVMEADSAI